MRSHGRCGGCSTRRRDATGGRSCRAGPTTSASSTSRRTHSSRRSPRRRLPVMEAVKVACVQAEPVLFDRSATIEKIDGLAAEIAAADAHLALFPEAFVPAYPSSRWARHLAGWDGDARSVYARLARESLTIPGPDADRLGEIARTRGLWLAVGANELERGTIYNSLLIYSPAGELALRHRKLMP